MSHLSTHVLDTATGRPASGVTVTLEGRGGVLARGSTDADGRITDLGPDRLDPATYRLRFDTGQYAAETGTDGFFPEVVVAFVVRDTDHLHVPLLLSPFGYSTYRGS
ncbi:hydroxyisourate hydrolase [Nocardioides sp.]|jgi:5-hydroxyisourate hydrolase|uniref:hydroxyisourate hydrolase n=1 Tax=Nocardioides sp. TaxID=35761 RepID=UPI002F3E62E4